MLSGGASLRLLRRPAPSGATTPMPPGATAAPIAAGCAFVAAVFARADTTRRLAERPARRTEKVAVAVATIARHARVLRAPRKPAKPLPPKQPANALVRIRHPEGLLDLAPNVENTPPDNPAQPTTAHRRESTHCRCASDPEDLRDPPRCREAPRREPPGGPCPPLTRPPRDRRPPEPAPPSKDARSAPRPSPNAQGAANPPPRASSARRPAGCGRPGEKFAPPRIRRSGNEVGKRRAPRYPAPASGHSSSNVALQARNPGRPETMSGRG